MVVGGGFIGIELAENLHHRGLEITLVEMMEQVMAPLDAEMAAIVHQHLHAKHVRLALGDGLKAIEQTDGGLSVVLQSDRRAGADMVILAIGVRPESTLARDADLELGIRGTIATNKHMQTSDPDIYAIGDAVQVTHLVTGQPANVPLAGPASKQGRLVADHIAGRDTRYTGVQGTAIIKAFDLSVATTGLNRRALEQADIPFRSTIVHMANHAGYYPGAAPLSIKLLFAANGGGRQPHAAVQEGKILGAQVIGREGVDKRIDVIATALRAGLTVFDLEELELAYAPPYGSARDPINIAGFVAANILRGDVNTIGWDDVASLDAQSDFLLDVRDPHEFAAGSIDGATNISLNQLRDRLNELPRERRIVVYCLVGQRAYYACRILLQHGFDTVNLSGGCKTYRLVTAPQSNF